MKTGDKVKYSKAGMFGWESKDWAEGDGLVLGEVYTVLNSETDHPEPAISVEEGYCNLWVHPDHFELVED